MRAVVAIRLIAAQLTGLLVLAGVSTFYSASPGLDDTMLVLAVGLYASVFVFIPVLVLAVTFAPVIIRNPISFVIAGPLILSGALALLAGWWVVIPVGFTSVIGSIVYLILTKAGLPRGPLAET